MGSGPKGSSDQFEAVAMFGSSASLRVPGTGKIRNARKIETDGIYRMSRHVG